MKPILELELCDVWGIYFMGLFVSSYFMKYILVVVENVPKQVKVVELPNNKGHSVTTFLKKNVFSQFGTSRAIISYGGLYSTVFYLRSFLRNML